MNKPTHISDETLKKILAGKLTPEQQAQWNAFFDENPFEKEALEGLKMVSAEELEQDLQNLQKRIAAKRRTNYFSYKAIAASIAILLASVVVVLYFTRYPDVATDMSFENTSKPKMEKQETPSPKEPQIRTDEQYQVQKNEEKVIYQKDNPLPQAENTPNYTQKELNELQYAEAEKSLEVTRKDKEVEALRETIEKEIGNKIEENKPIEWGRQDEVLGSRRGEGAAATKIEKAEKSPAYSEKDSKEKKQKTYKYEENRVLNISKEEAYQETTVVLQGKAFDAQTQKALGNVKITLKGYSQSTLTDSLGNFSLKVPQLEKYILLVETPSYENLEVEAKPNQKNGLYLKKKK